MFRETTVRPMANLADFQEALRRSEEAPVVLFKHSTYCSISASARQRMRQLDQSDDPAVYELIIQNTRMLSTEIAEFFNIRHESPQIIVVFKGRPIYHTSHGSISAETIRNAISSRQASHI